MPFPIPLLSIPDAQGTGWAFSKSEVNGWKVKREKNGWNTKRELNGWVARTNDMDDLANEVVIQIVGETRTWGYNFSNLPLQSGVTLTGTPTITVSPSGPTLSGKSVNSSATTVNGVTVAAGLAAQVTVAGVTAKQDYLLTFTVATTDSQTIIRKATIKAEAV